MLFEICMPDYHPAFEYGRVVYPKYGANAAARAQSEQAQQAAALSRETLAFYKSQYEAERPARERAQALAEEVSNQQLASSKLQDTISKDYWDYQKNTFRPLETGIVADAQNYDTAERRQAESDAAVADVNQQVSAQRAATSRELARSGVSPEAGKALAIAEAGGINAAKAAAGASYQARKGVETTGWARKMDAASLGRNLASNQATSAQIASQLGTSAVGSSVTGLAVGQSATQQMGQGYGQALAGVNTAANIYGQQAANATAMRGQDMALIGQAMGSAAAAYASDKKIKRDIGKLMNGSDALDAIEATPVHEGWKYDPAKGGPDEGGVAHDGPMAQDVQKNMGDTVAPGGKMIDIISMNGVLLSGIKEVASQQKKINKRLAALEGVN